MPCSRTNPYRPPFYHPGENDEAIQYLQERRRALGGYLPERRTKYTPAHPARRLAPTRSPDAAPASRRSPRPWRSPGCSKTCCAPKDFGHRIVPIIPDEARTFGMDAYFPTAKIYNPNGQHYTSVDRELLLAYQESAQGQILHVGINEAGAFAAFTAAGTSYSTHGEPLIPVYIFYSMFGFQRTGDGMWAAGDQMARGFIIGATAGRTTLTGEGLQHADGQSPLLASTNPSRRLATTPPTATSSATSSGPASSACTAARIRTPTSCTTSRSTTSRCRSRPSRRASTSTGCCRASTCCAAGRERRAAPRRSCSPPGVACRGRSRRSGCSPTTGTCPPMSGRSPPGRELRRDGLAANEHNFLHPDDEPGCRTSPQSSPRRRGRSLP